MEILSIRYCSYFASWYPAWNECMGWGARTRSTRAKAASSTRVAAAVLEQSIAGLQKEYVAAPMMAAA